MLLTSLYLWGNFTHRAGYNNPIPQVMRTVIFLSVINIIKYCYYQLLDLLGFACACIDIMSLPNLIKIVSKVCGMVAE